MSGNNEQKWRDATQEILDKLDIKAEYEALGLRVSSHSPSAAGWVPARGMGRDDNSPSAGINIGTGALRGRYKDFGGKNGESGECLGLFDFAAKYGKFPDWKEARKHYAKTAGVKLPKCAEERTLDKFDDFTLTPSGCLTWCRTKPPITWQAVMEAGAVGKVWPNDAPDIGKNHLISFPMFGQYLADADPTGYQSVHYGGGKIRVFKGQGAPPDFRPKQTNGTPGLMNAYGVQHLEEATTVWLLEGLTSMLALQSIIPKDGSAVAISYGAASYRPRHEWLHHFAGKDVRVIGDVDPSGVGQAGAEVWCHALLPVAGSVKNIVLPYQPDEDKSDLRDWINDQLLGEKIDEENAARVYRHLCVLASDAEPISPDRPKEELVEPHQVILQCLGCVVLGKVEGTSHIECFSTVTKSKFIIKNISRFQEDDLLLEIGGEVFDRYITTKKDGEDGKFTFKEARQAIAREAAIKATSPDIPLGDGIWNVDNNVLLVTKGRADVWDGVKLSEFDHPIYEGKKLEFGHFDWFDRDKLNLYLQKAADIGWRSAQIDKTVANFGRWNNWHRETNPELLTGLVLATRLQTLWKFRPLTAVSGPTNCGKTWLLELLRDLLLIERVVGKTTAAFIRQDIACKGHPYIIDEFEHCRDRQLALEDFRMSTAGDGVIGRGSSSGRGGIRYRMKHMIWVGGVELGLKDGPDKNRYIFLNLNEVPPDAGNTLEEHSTEEAIDMGHRLIACGLRTWKMAAALMEAFKKRTFYIGEAKVDRRIAQCFATPVACLAAARGLGESAAVDEMHRILTGRVEVVDQASSDEETLIEDIISSVVFCPGGHKVTVSDLLTSPDISHSGWRLTWPERDHMLQTNGIRIMSGEHRGWLFLAARKINRELLKGTRHNDRDIAQILKRAQGSVPAKLRVSGQPLNGVLIPSSSFAGLNIPDDPDIAFSEVSSERWND